MIEYTFAPTEEENNNIHRDRKCVRARPNCKTYELDDNGDSYCVECNRGSVLYQKNIKEINEFKEFQPVCVKIEDLQPDIN